MYLTLWPLAGTAFIMLLLAIEDYKSKSIKTWRSRIYEAAIGVSIILNFIFNWELAFELLVCGVAFYLVAIPALTRLFKEKYNYQFHRLDQEIFILTMIGWPFISLLAFSTNQAANIVYALIKRVFRIWDAEMPQLVLYGAMWFMLAMVALALYIQ